MSNVRRSVLFVLAPLAALLVVAFLILDQNPAPAPSNAEEPDRADSTLAKATFAGGCFWCVESAFQDVNGVKAAVSGFSGGTQPDPSYKEVASGATDYAESVQVTYDPDTISYQQLLHLYWRDIDPTDAGGQFADRGSQYRPVIFYHNERQKRLAKQSKKALAETGPFEEPIVVTIEPFDRFYKAKEDHQDYYKTHPERYKQYFEGSGRAPFLRKTWGTDHPTLESFEPATSEANASGAESASAENAPAAGVASTSYLNFERPSEQILRERLTDMQYEVTQQNGTEPPYKNEYYDNKRAGIYVDVVSGEPLYSSTHKFDSDTGWPSFYKPLEPKYIVKKEDRSAGLVRTEVRSKIADSHLGHVFEWNGPPEVPTGKRHCINSAALEFIPADALEERGYGKYASLFEKTADRRR